LTSSKIIAHLRFEELVTTGSMHIPNEYESAQQDGHIGLLAPPDLLVFDGENPQHHALSNDTVPSEWLNNSANTPGNMAEHVSCSQQLYQYGHSQ
jgi:hypothetical protein